MKNDSAKILFDGKRKDLIVCLTCYHTFDHNEAGELVKFGRFLG